MEQLSSFEIAQNRMEQLSSFEIAQNRIEKRRQKSNRLKFGIIILILTAFVTLFEISLLVCTAPIMVCLGLALLVDGIEIYVTSTGRELAPGISNSK